MKTLSIVSTILLYIALYSCQKSHPNLQQVQLERDSVAIWIKHSQTTSLSNDLKIQSLNRAYQKLKSIPEDSIRPSQLSTIAYRFYELNDSINFFKINNKTPYESLECNRKSILNIEIDVMDKDEDNLQYQYSIVPESTDIKSGGDKELAPEPIWSETSTKPIDKINSPSRLGKYRLFLHVSDNHGNAATANFPFRVIN